MIFTVLLTSQVDDTNNTYTRGVDQWMNFT